MKDFSVKIEDETTIKSASTSSARNLFDDIEEQAGGEIASQARDPLFKQENWWETEGGRSLWSSVRRRSRLRWLDLLSPFTGAASTILAAQLFVWIESLAPGQSGPLSLIVQGSRLMAVAWLISGLLTLVLRPLRRRLLPKAEWSSFAGRRFTRRVLKVFGRPGYYVWRLTAPAWLVLIGGPLLMLGSLVVRLIQHIWNSLPSAPERPSPPPGGPATIGQGIKSMIRIMRIMLFFMGILFFGFGIMSYLMERPWASKMMGGMACFGMGAMATLIDKFGDENTGIAGGPAFDN